MLSIRRSKFVSGGFMFVSGRFMLVSARFMLVSGGFMLVSGGFMLVSGGFMLVSGGFSSFQVVSARFSWFQLVTAFSKYVRKSVLKFDRRFILFSSFILLSKLMKCWLELNSNETSMRKWQFCPDLSFDPTAKVG